MGKPLISILTTTFNDEKTIADTLQSIKEQTFTEWEHIIQDGGSTDKTIKILTQFADKQTHFESKQDKGIYDALNKAVLRANGKWIIVIQSGDSLYSTNTLQEISQYLSGNIDILYGNILSYRNNNVYVHKSLPLSYLPIKMVGSHQAMFIKRSLLLKFPYDLKYDIAADYDFLFKSYKNDAKFKKISIPIAKVDGYGLASTKIVENYIQKNNIAYKYNKSIYYLSIRILRIYILKIKIVIKKILPNNIVHLIQKWKARSSHK